MAIPSALILLPLCLFLSLILQWYYHGVIITNSWIRRQLNTMSLHKWFPCNQIKIPRGSVIAIHPHGILCCGALVGVHFVPGSETVFCVAPILFYVPVVGWCLRLIGCIPADYEIMLQALKKGHTIIVVPGGVPEMVLAETGNDQELFKRHGFLRLAVEARCNVVSVLVRGECQTFRMIAAPFLRQRVTLSYHLNIPLVFPLFFGYYGTWLPRRVPLRIVWWKTSKNKQEYQELLKKKYYNLSQISSNTMYNSSIWMNSDGKSFSIGGRNNISGVVHRFKRLFDTCSYSSYSSARLDILDNFRLLDNFNETVKYYIKNIFVYIMPIALATISFVLGVADTIFNAKSKKADEVAAQATRLALSREDYKKEISGDFQTITNRTQSLTELQAILTQLESRITSILSDYTALLNQISIVSTLMLGVATATFGALLGNTEDQPSWKINLYVISCVMTVCLSILSVIESFFLFISMRKNLNSQQVYILIIKRQHGHLMSKCSRVYPSHTLPPSSPFSLPSFFSPPIFLALFISDSENQCLYWETIIGFIQPLVDGLRMSQQ